MDCASMMLDVEGVGAVNGAPACTAGLTFGFLARDSLAWFDRMTKAQRAAAALFHSFASAPPSKHPHSLIPPTYGVNLTRSFREPARAAR